MDKQLPGRLNIFKAAARTAKKVDVRAKIANRNQAMLADNFNNPNMPYSTPQRIRGAAYSALENATLGNAGGVGRAIMWKRRGDRSAFKRELSSAFSMATLGNMGMLGEAFSAKLTKTIGTYDDNPDIVDEVNNIPRRKAPGQSLALDDVLKGLNETAENLDNRFNLIRKNVVDIADGFSKFDDRVKKIEEVSQENITKASEKILEQMNVNQPQMSALNDIQQKVDSIANRVTENESKLASIGDDLKRKVNFLEQRLDKGIHGKGASNDNVPGQTVNEKTRFNALKKLFMSGGTGVGASGMLARAGKAASMFAATPAGRAASLVGGLGAGAAGIYGMSKMSSAGGSYTGTGSTGNMSFASKGSGTNIPNSGSIVPTSRSKGKIDRRAFDSELRNPAVKERFYTLMEAEVGSQGPAAQQAWAETVFNRAAADGTSLEKILSNTRYYQPYQDGAYSRASRRMNSDKRKVYGDIIKQVAAGSNMTKGATHNASANVAASVRRGGYDADTSTIQMIGGETFYGKTFKKERKFRSAMPILQEDQKTQFAGKGSGIPDWMNPASLVGTSAQAAIPGISMTSPNISKKGKVIQSQLKSAKIRKKPINNKLEKILDRVSAETGVIPVIWSGGQRGIGDKGPGKRIGSTRHDRGNAADMDFYVEGKDGKRRLLKSSSSSDRSKISQFIRKSASYGITGVGGGSSGYMGANRFHLGFGDEAVWRSPKWVRDSFWGGRKNQIDLETLKPIMAAAENFVIPSESMNSKRPDYFTTTGDEISPTKRNKLTSLVQHAGLKSRNGPIGIEGNNPDQPFAAATAQLAGKTQPNQITTKENVMSSKGGMMTKETKTPLNVTAMPKRYEAGSLAPKDVNVKSPTKAPTMMEQSKAKVAPEAKDAYKGEVKGDPKEKGSEMYDSKGGKTIDKPYFNPESAQPSPGDSGYGDYKKCYI